MESETTFPCPLHVHHRQIWWHCQGMGIISRVSHDSANPRMPWEYLDRLTKVVGTHCEPYEEFPAEFDDCLTRACDSVIDLCGSFGPNWHAAVSRLRERVTETVEEVMHEIAPHVPLYAAWDSREPIEHDPLPDEPVAFNLSGVFGFIWFDDAPPTEGELLLCDRLGFLDEMALSRAEAALLREFTLALDGFRQSSAKASGNSANRATVAAPEPAPSAEMLSSNGVVAGDAHAECLVTLYQAAALVNRSKKTLERRKDRMPLPRVEGGGGKPAEWAWKELRPWLEQEFERSLPERFPADRFSAS